MHIMTSFITVHVIINVTMITTIITITVKALLRPPRGAK